MVKGRALKLHYGNRRLTNSFRNRKIIYKILSTGGTLDIICIFQHVERIFYFIKHFLQGTLQFEVPCDIMYLSV